jgi:hypothetical protein
MRFADTEEICKGKAVRSRWRQKQYKPWNAKDLSHQQFRERHETVSLPESLRKPVLPASSLLISVFQTYQS